MAAQRPCAPSADSTTPCRTAPPGPGGDRRPSIDCEQRSARTRFAFCLLAAGNPTRWLGTHRSRACEARHGSAAHPKESSHGPSVRSVCGPPWKPWDGTSPAATRSISPKRRPAVTAPTQDRIGLNDHQAFAPSAPPTRQQNPKQSINATETRAPGSATLQHGNLMAQRDRFQPQRGAGPGFASGDRDRCA